MIKISVIYTYILQLERWNALYYTQILKTYSGITSNYVRQNVLVDYHGSHVTRIRGLPKYDFRSFPNYETRTLFMEDTLSTKVEYVYIVACILSSKAKDLLSWIRFRHSIQYSYSIGKKSSWKTFSSILECHKHRSFSLSLSLLTFLYIIKHKS